MAKFPADRVYRKTRHGFWRSAGIFLLLALMVIGAWQYGKWTDGREPVPVDGLKIYVVDGDSFMIGSRKLRLDGIDAPELKQICNGSDGTPWSCGRTARAALEKLLTEPGLTCEAEISDRYARSLATCRTQLTADIAAMQVREGMAVSHEFNDMRDFGAEEDAARRAKRGIWRGNFERPEIWRTNHPRG